MANPHRGEVELKTEDQTYILKLGLNKMLELEKDAEPLTGARWMRFVLHQALISSDAQKDMTLDDAGDLIDDVGIDEVNELIEKTKWGSMAKRASDKAEAKRKENATKVEGDARPQAAGTLGATSQ